MKALPQVLRREPVLLGAALVALFEASFPDASSAWKLACGAGVAWVVRLLSTSNVVSEAKVADASANAKNEALADVASLVPIPDPAPVPAKKAAVKKK